MNESFLPFFLFFLFFEWLNEWDYCVIFVRVYTELNWMNSFLFVCLFVFFSIRWKRQTGRLRWLTKHYLISLNFWIAQCGTTRIWVSQTKSTRMWNHFDCRRDRFFSRCVDSIQNDKEKMFQKKKKSNQTNFLWKKMRETNEKRNRSCGRFDPLRPASDWRLNWHGWLYSHYYT